MQYNSGVLKDVEHMGYGKNFDLPTADLKTNSMHVFKLTYRRQTNTPLMHM